MEDFISVSVDSKAFESTMKALKQNTKNLAPAFRSFGEFMTKETHNNYERESTPEGQKWEALKPATLARKKGKGILREKLIMFNAFYYKATNDGFEMGIKDPKYSFHHDGTDRMAARPVLGITNEQRGELNSMVRLQIKRVRGGKNRAPSKR